MTAVRTAGCRRQGNPIAASISIYILSVIAATECLHGSFGWNCNQTCPSGFYGRLCQSPCKCKAHDCHYVTGCTRGNTTDNWSENTTDKRHRKSTSLEWLDKTKDWQTRNTSSLKPSNVFEWSNKTTDMQTIITSSMYPAGRHDQYEIVNQHDATWLAVSCSLIGSLATLVLIGCFLYFRSRRKLKKNAPKGIQRILFSRLEPDRNLQHHPQEGHLELSTLIPTQQCYSQIGSFCAEAGVDINEKGNKISTERRRITKSTNLYEKCSFETEYDHVNLKMNSSSPGSLHKEGGIVSTDVQENVVLPDKGRSQKKFPNHDGSCKSLTLPLNLKRVTKNNKLKSHSYSLCHVVSENELEVDQDKTDKEENCVVKFLPGNLVNASYSKVKEEARPYSFVHSLINDELNTKEVYETSTAVFNIITPDVKEDLEEEDPGRLINRPYSYVKKS
ncbi:uncharacterized protein LOC133175278 [Saccostrea echinata]|uniref:uncharacterized protein LOC133175278 n=1 Tax=Saccostrea echinata TaxID=191078 RepID=UPI002A82F40D|nr:uncharacterized protein LOC133175278 [Saccostrea echinata]